jgi:hypothetical protein
MPSIFLIYLFLSFHFNRHFASISFLRHFILILYFLFMQNEFFAGKIPSTVNETLIVKLLEVKRDENVVFNTKNDLKN